MKVNKYKYMSVIQAFIEGAWSDLTQYDHSDKDYYKVLRDDLKTYQDNDPYPHRVIKRKEINPEWEAQPRAITTAELIERCKRVAIASGTIEREVTKLTTSGALDLSKIDKDDYTTAYAIVAALYADEMRYLLDGAASTTLKRKQHKLYNQLRKAIRTDY
jgi:hypothetical protein